MKYYPSFDDKDETDSTIELLISMRGKIGFGIPMMEELWCRNYGSLGAASEDAISLGRAAQLAGVRPKYFRKIEDDGVGTSPIRIGPHLVYDRPLVEWWCKVRRIQPTRMELLKKNLTNYRRNFLLRRLERKKYEYMVDWWGDRDFCSENGVFVKASVERWSRSMKSKHPQHRLVMLHHFGPDEDLEVAIRRAYLLKEQRSETSGIIH